jgi:hypothetical protein
MTFEYLSILAAARMSDGFVVASVGMNCLIAGKCVNNDKKSCKIVDLIEEVDLE